MALAKLTAPAAADGALATNAAWGTPIATCSQTMGQMFGRRMPDTYMPDTIGAAKLAPIRDWICAGTPKP